jgi:hypothetical protein
VQQALLVLRRKAGRQAEANEGPLADDVALELEQLVDAQKLLALRAGPAASA